MSSGEAAASRSGGAGGTQAASRRGRLDEGAWRDVARLIKLGTKNDAHAVEIHGVRVVFKRSGANSSQDTKEKDGSDEPANRRCVESASAPKKHEPKAPNSAKRRSAQRMQEYLHKKGAAPQAAEPTTSVEPQAQAPAPVEIDERAGAQPMETTEADGGQHGDEAVESAASAPTSSSLPQQPLSREGQPAKLRRVESTGRQGRGLRVAPPEEIRRSRVSFALENARADHHY